MDNSVCASPDRAISSRRKVCVLGGSFETGNLGVTVLTSSTLMLLARHRPEADLFLLDYTKQPRVHTIRAGTATVEAGTLALRFSKKIWLENNILLLLLYAGLARCIPQAQARQTWWRASPTLRRLLEMDLAVALGAGDSFSDLYGARQYLYVLLPQILVILLGKPIVQLPQTIGPFRAAWARRAAGWVLRRARVVYSRDRISLDQVKTLAGKQRHRVKFCYDLGFVLEPRKPSADALNWLPDAKAAGELIGFNISGLLYMGGYTKDNMFGLRADYRALMRAILEFLAATPGQVVVLISHVFGEGADSESDYKAAREVWSGLSSATKAKVRLPKLPRDHQEIKYIIGQCDLFIGSRMHACIAALSQSVPAVSLAYSGKFRGVMESLDLEEVVADLRELTPEQVIQRIAHVMEHREALRAQIARRMAEVRATIDQVFVEMLPEGNHWHE